MFTTSRYGLPRVHNIGVLRNKKHNRKSPQIAGLRPPMCWTIFLAGKLWIHWIVNIFVHYATTMTPQRLAVIWRGRSPILGYRELRDSWGSGVGPIESPSKTIHKVFKYKVLLYLSTFGLNSNVILWPPKFILRGPRGSQMVRIEMSSHITIQLLYTL